MIATCHLLVGAVIATKTQNPILGLLFAFLSHYILDLIPHCEYIKSLKSPQGRPLSAFIKISADIAFGMTLLLILAENKLLALGGGLLAIAPDFDNILYVFPQLMKVRLFRIESYIHSEIVHRLENKKIPLFVKILSQVLVFFIAVYFLCF